MFNDATSVLDELSPDEILRIVESAYPAEAKRARSHLEHLQWLRTHGEWARILPHLPTKAILRIQESTRSPQSNPMNLDEQAHAFLKQHLKPYSRLLTTRALDYVDEFGDLRWLASQLSWQAGVWGTREYRVTLALNGSDSCTCPYHRDWGECKHAAALCMRLLKECDKLGIGTSPTHAPGPAPESGQILPFPASRPTTEPTISTQPPAASLPATGRTGSEGRGDRFRLDATLALRRIADEFALPDTTSRNPRMRVAYALQLQGQKPRSRSGELVPRTEYLQKNGDWQLDGADLRRSLGNRARTNPPQYLSQIDITLIQECTPTNTYTWPPTPPPTLQYLLGRAWGIGRLVNGQGKPMDLDPSYWRPVPRLAAHDDEAVFELHLVATDSSEQRMVAGDGWVWTGRQGDQVVVDGHRVLRIDPRTPAALLRLFDDAERMTTASLGMVRRELSLLARNGAEIPAEHLPKVLREAPLRQVSIQSRPSGFSLSQVFAYPSLTVPVGSEQPLLEFTDESGELMQLERNQSAERILSEELDRILLDAGVVLTLEDTDRTVTEYESIRNLALTGISGLMESGWDVVDASLLAPWRRRTGMFRMSGKASGQDWFELSGVVDFDGMEIPISTLVASRGAVNLPDGSTGELSSKVMERLRWMERLGEKTNNGIRLRGVHAMLAKEMAESGFGQVRDPAAWKREIEPFTNQAIEPVPVPAKLLASLRPYQKDGLDWLGSLRKRGLGGILADDMGLGKTVQLIAHLCAIYEQDPSAPPALVVGPASVAGNWVSEIARFAPHLSVRLLHGLGRDEIRDAQIDSPTIFVTTYGTLAREARWLEDMDFSLAVFDESQAIRNPATVAHQTCALVRARQKTCLTGTPIENSLSDLWAQYSILNPGLLGPKQAFMDQFAPFPGEAPDLSRLRLLTAPFWLRRTKHVVAKDLPPREDILLEVELDPKQKALYQRQLKDYQKHLLPELRRSGLNDGGRFQVLTALLRLRQIACAPELAGHKGPAAKLDVLVEKLVEDISEGHRALVFSSFTSLLDLVEKRLRKERVEFLRLDGSTPARERTRLIHRFQNGLDEPVFLVSLKAGGAGVNLTAADYVFLLDPWWNPAVEEQAAARAHRIGQTDPVTIYRLVAKDTIEERVLALARGKAALASALFETGETGGKVLTMEVVQELLG